MNIRKITIAVGLAAVMGLTAGTAQAFWGGWMPWDWGGPDYYYPGYYGGYPGWGGYPGYYGGYPGWGGYPGYYGGYPGWGGYPGYYGGYPGWGGYPWY